ncbi:MAG TPA: FG-GAP-like repeat-containing protein [Ignavibacteria bacterium]|nr:FG-GAP-like repeat-containing protein [Ignavibacteria bacterium]
MKTLILSLLAVIATFNLSYSQYFTKVTTGQFVNDAGASRAVTLIDYNNDGQLDIYVTNGPQPGAINFLYKNNGNGTFTKITDLTIVNDVSRDDGASWADIDNDGFLDLCFVNWGNNTDRLYRNNTMGNFTFLNTSPVSTNFGFSEAVSFGDYDNDGLVDIFITNSFGANHKNFLYKNLGNTNYVKVDTGIAVSETADSRGLNWIDIDNDGDLDIYVTNEVGQNNFLYVNNGSGYFTKNTTSIISNDASNSWSGSWGDYDNDGDQDLFIANHGKRPNALYRNEGNFTFTKINSSVINNDSGYHASSSWVDFDNDGDLDIFTTQAYGPVNVKLVNKLYKNLLMETSQPNFEKITNDASVSDSGYSYGLAFGDMNSDGFPDLYIANTFNESQNNYYYVNNGNSNNYLQIKTVGTSSNKAGIGTKIKIKANINGNPVWQTRVVEGQAGYCSQNLWLNFGFGNAAIADSVKVIWPSGNINHFTNVELNRFITVTENGGIVNIKKSDSYSPQKFELKQNFPNPFNPETNIKFSVSKSDFIKLIVYDLTGKEVKSLVNANLTSGNYVVTFNAEGLSSGVYFYSLISGDFVSTKQMILLK